jgi:hypothetical protein
MISSKILWALIAGSGCLSVAALQRTHILNSQLDTLRMQVSLRDGVVEHKYRFERSGASLWRYDETTGAACQITSNHVDNWVGGRCPADTANQGTVIGETPSTVTFVPSKPDQLTSK